MRRAVRFFSSPSHGFRQTGHTVIDACGSDVDLALAQRAVQQFQAVEVGGVGDTVDLALEGGDFLL